jgi:hypothetical protein
MGDASDSLNLNGAAYTAQDSVSIAGMEDYGSFYHYVVNQNGEDLHLYLQNVQLV